MSRSTRREFFQYGVGAWAGLGLAGPSPHQLEAESRYLRESRAAGRLNVGVIGCGGKGFSDGKAMRRENVVAICDVDWKRGAGLVKEFPKARRYSDFRVMLEREKYLDAVTVSTPDHTHAVAALAAMQRGLHVFCQKPLTHSVEEARILRMAARKHGVVTQMGNQGTAMEGVRRAAELVRDGVIGKVKEAHVWTNRPGNWWPQGIHRPKGVIAIPEHFRWDLWLGPRAHRPYQKGYHPFAWRGFWDFGTGAIGDMACHTMNMAYMALELDAPDWVEAEQEGVTEESGPKWSMIRFGFPARGKKPPLHLTWYDGGKLPPIDLIPEEARQPRKSKDGKERPFKLAGSGSLLIGDKGVLYSPNDYGARFFIYPEERTREYDAPEPTLPRSPGIHKEWLLACKGAGPTPMSNFDYAGRFTETALLGNVAVRAGEKVEWDQGRMRSRNSERANRFVRDEYAFGYSMEL